MPISADQIYVEEAQAQLFKKKPPRGILDQVMLGEPFAITKPQTIVASNICPVLPSLPPLNHS